MMYKAFLKKSHIQYKYDGGIHKTQPNSHINTIFFFVLLFVLPSVARWSVNIGTRSYFLFWLWCLTWTYCLSLQTRQEESAQLRTNVDAEQLNDS